MGCSSLTSFLSVELLYKNWKASPIGILGSSVLDPGSIPELDAEAVSGDVPSSSARSRAACWIFRVLILTVLRKGIDGTPSSCEARALPGEGISRHERTFKLIAL